MRAVPYGKSRHAEGLLWRRGVGERSGETGLGPRSGETVLGPRSGETCSRREGQDRPILLGEEEGDMQVLKVCLRVSQSELFRVPGSCCGDG